MDELNEYRMKYHDADKKLSNVLTVINTSDNSDSKIALIKSIVQTGEIDDSEEESVVITQNTMKRKAMDGIEHERHHCSTKKARYDLLEESEDESDNSALVDPVIPTSTSANTYITCLYCGIPKRREMFFKKTGTMPPTDLIKKQMCTTCYGKSRSCREHHLNCSQVF
jgi:hypothetical protein